MADFCKQCSLEIFNEDFGDLAGIASEGQVIITICEGCVGVRFDHEGQCVDPKCKEHACEK